ncbi:MAG TPA: hypothetical protein VF887_02745 [Gemmatimonadaceae bacterium]
MMVRSHRLILVVVVASLVGCIGGGPERMFTKNGEDLIVLGSTMIYPADSIAGDVIFAGGEFRFTGSSGGDYLGAGGSQTIGGRIHGSIRAAGGDVHAVSTVDRNATIAGGNVTLDSTGAIAGNAYIIGGNVGINGTVRGSLMATGGRVVLNGPVGRDVEVSAGELHLGPHAQIAGNLRYRVPKDKVTIDRAARVSGTTTALPVSTGLGLRGTLWVLGFFLAGVVVVALFPGFASDAADILPLRPVRSALVGLGWAVLVPCAIVIAAITVIGLPLAIITAALYMVALVLSDVPFALWLGRLLLGARAGVGRQGALLNFFVGGIVLLLVGLVPILGKFVMTIASILGLGAIMLRAKGVREAEPVPLA